MIGAIVDHRSFGRGIVTGFRQDRKRVWLNISFSCGEKVILYSGEYLKFSDPEKQQVLDEAVRTAAAEEEEAIALFLEQWHREKEEKRLKKKGKAAGRPCNLDCLGWQIGLPFGKDDTHPSGEVGYAPGFFEEDMIDGLCAYADIELEHIMEFASGPCFKNTFNNCKPILTMLSPCYRTDTNSLAEYIVGYDPVFYYIYNNIPFIAIYYRNIACKSYRDYKTRISYILAHEYFHFINHTFAGVNFENQDDPHTLQVTESLADFFALLYLLHKHEFPVTERRMEKEIYEMWEAEFNEVWATQAKALWFFRQNGVQLPFSSKFQDYIDRGQLDKFIEVFKASGTDMKEAYEKLII